MGGEETLVLANNHSNDRAGKGTRNTSSALAMDVDLSRAQVDIYIKIGKRTFPSRDFPLFASSSPSLARRTSSWRP